MTPPATEPAALHDACEPETWKRRWSDILVYLECRDGALHPASLQVLHKALELARGYGCAVHGIAIGEDRDDLRAQLARVPLARVYLYVTETQHPVSEAYSAPFQRCVERLRPSVVLVAATPAGKAVAPRLAAAFGSGLTADCTDLALRENGDLVQTRPAYGGDIMARIVTGRSRPQFATVRPDVMPALEEIAPEPSAKLVVEPAEPLLEAGVAVLAVDPRPSSHDIARARILVVAGRGLRRREDMDLLRTLAGLLGGELAATRGVVERGWASADRQIGLSGHSVSPELLITCGVSGSVQFLVGVRRAKTIVAIDVNREARIFDVAHYPILGDLYEIVPEMLACLDAPGECRDAPRPSQARERHRRT